MPSPLRKTDLRWLLPGIIAATIAGHAVSLFICYRFPAKVRTIRHIANRPGTIELISTGRQTLVYDAMNIGEMAPPVGGTFTPSAWSRGRESVVRDVLPSIAFQDSTGKMYMSGFATLQMYEQALGFPWPELYSSGICPGTTVSGIGWTVTGAQGKELAVQVPLKPPASFPGSTMSMNVREPIGVGFRRAIPIAVFLNTCAYALAAILLLPLPVILWRNRRRKRGHCPTCNYDRAGLSPVAPCPECGTPPQASPI